MAQYVHALVAQRSFPLSSAYYQRGGTNADMVTGHNAMSVPLSRTPPHHHDQTNWPHHYNDPPSTQPPPAFASYVGAPAPVPSSSYASSWQQNTSQSAVTAVGASVSSSDFPIRVYDPSGSYEAFSEPPPPPDYPTSSQRTILQPSPSPPRNFLPLYGFRNDRHRSPSSHTSSSDFGWENPAPAVDEHQQLPTNTVAVDDSQSAEQGSESVDRHHSAPASSHTSVKIEDNDPDGCFIMELPAPGSGEGAFGCSTPLARAAYTLSMLSQSLAPPTEVPLRATQASKEMKKMMGVFRLNPFAMHSLSVKLEDREDGLAWDEDSQPPWCGGRPLDEEPLMFEFQLDLNGTEAEEEDEEGAERRAEISREKGLEALEASDLRSFSPSFELHRDDIDARDQESLGHHLEQDQEQEYDQDQRSESWGEVDGSNHSGVDTNSTTTTRSVPTPFNDNPEGIQQAISGYSQHSQRTSPPVWDLVGAHYQVTEEGPLPTSELALPTLPVGPKVDTQFGYANVRGPRLHNTTSHPYLRKSLQNHQTGHSHSHIQSQRHPSPSFPLLHQATHHSQGQDLLHPSNPPEYNGDTNRCEPLNFSYTEQHQNQHRMYAPISSSSMMDVQPVDAPMQPSCMRLIRGPRYHDLDHGHNTSGYPLRSMSSMSKVVGGYTSSSEASHLSTLMHPHQVGGHGVNRRWSLPETGVMHSGPFLSSM